jgi:signal transduction histidine kinase
MIETGQFTVEPKAEDVPALLSEAASLLEPQAAARGLQLKVDVSDDIPTIQCDRGRVLQVIGNLVGNAIKFTQSGGEIRIAVRPVDDAIQVSVSDTGAGIPENQIPHIFERYWKGKTKGIQGTGLGLYIVKAIVKAHGGRIWVESAVAEGTTFFFTLPVVPSAVAEPRPSERGAEYPPPFDLPV